MTQKNKIEDNTSGEGTEAMPKRERSKTEAMAAELDFLNSLDGYAEEAYHRGIGKKEFEETAAHLEEKLEQLEEDFGALVDIKRLKGSLVRTLDEMVWNSRKRA